MNRAAGVAPGPDRWLTGINEGDGPRADTVFFRSRAHICEGRFVRRPFLAQLGWPDPLQPIPAARSPQRQVLEDLLDHLPLRDGSVDFQLARFLPAVSGGNWPSRTAHLTVPADR